MGEGAVLADETGQAKKSILERYLDESEAREVTVPSGFVFLVSGMTKVEFAEILGGLPPIAMTASKEEATAQERKNSEALERGVYERFVKGLLDPETRKVEKVPFDRILSTDMDALLTSAMRRGGLDTQKAESIRRAL